MRIFNSTLLAAVMLTALPVGAQSGDPIFDLTDRATFQACSQFSDVYDHDSYDVWQFNNYTGYPYMYNYNLTEPYYADYLLSAPIALEAGTLYRLELAPAAYNSGKTGKLKIGVGQGDNVSTYTVIKQFTDLPYANINTVVGTTVEFNVPVSGDYKIYFLGEGNALSLYNTKLFSVGSSDVPAAVSDLQVLPAPDGSASATVIFSMPSQSISGQYIDGQMNYRIYRNDEENAFRSGRGMAGEVISNTDNNVAIGNVTYSVEIVNGQDVSGRASVTTYVGPETPLPVTDLVVTTTAGSRTLSWTGPTMGEHGAVLDPSLISYVVTRYVNDEPTVVADNLAANTYTDTYTSNDLCNIKYAVQAKYNNALSTPVTSSELTLGSINLPFADSFAGASFGNVWTTEIVSGTFNWQALESYNSQFPRITEAYDKDGGFAFYNSYSASNGQSARLITPPINAAGSVNPVIEFYLLHHTSGIDEVRIEVSSDNGEWVEVPEAIARVIGTAGEWEKYTFPISAGIAEGADSYRVALHAHSKYGYNIIIDKVRIYNLANKDLEASIFSAPETIVSGNTATISFSVVNNSNTPVAADDYTLSLNTDYPGLVELPENQDVPALSSVMYSINVPFTAIEAVNADSYSFGLNVAYTGDEIPENNTSEDAVVSVVFSDNEAPGAANAEQLEDGSINITWAPAGDPNYVPVNATTSFEDFESGYTGPFDGYVSLDLDEDTSGGTYYTTRGSAFNIVANPTSPKGYDGNKMIGLTFGANKKQNDWLISPELNCPAGGTMNLSFMIATKAFSSSSYYYTFEVRYATEDYDPENPEAAFTHTIATKTSSQSYGDFRNSETFSTITFNDIPAEAKYIALYFCSKISVAAAIWIDNISITENILNPLLGYNLYEVDNARLNEEMLPTSQTSYLVSDATRSAGRQFFVTAVYPDGESNPSEYTSVITGVEQIANGQTTIYSTREGLVITGVKTPVDVYDLNGRHIATVTADSILRLSPAVYIVRTASESKKVIVK